MSIKETKEYLCRAYRIDQRINSKLEQVVSLRALVTKVTATYTDMPKGQGDISSRENIIVKIIDLEQLIKNDIDALVDFKTEAIEKIKTIPNVELQMLLELRYICFKPWDEIAEEMGFSLQHIFRLHSSALQEFSKILKDESKCD